MSWTKLQLVQQAYAKIGLAAYVFDISPEMVQSAIADMDAMMAEWSVSTQLGYLGSDSPASANGSDPSGLPNWANSAVYLSLSVRIAPDLGKTPAATLLAAAKDARDAVDLRVQGMPQEMQLPGTMPLGAGNKPWRWLDDPFIDPPDEDPIQVGTDGNLQFLSGT